MEASFLKELMSAINKAGNYFWTALWQIGLSIQVKLDNICYIFSDDDIESGTYMGEEAVEHAYESIDDDEADKTLGAAGKKNMNLSISIKSILLQF